MSTMLEVSGISISFDGFRAINNLTFQLGESELRRYRPQWCGQDDVHGHRDW